MDGLTILDGGMGHELKLRGVSDGTFVAGLLANENEKCAADNVVESIHMDYLAAGCDVITTNSFVAVPQRMIECGLAADEAGSKRRASELIRASVDRARSAITKYRQGVRSNTQKQLIAGCVPPLTECYFANRVPPSTDYLIPEYTVILSSLLGKVDILLAETLSTTREALAILRSLSSIQNTGTYRIPPLWVSFTVHDDVPTQLRSGEPLEMACRTIISQSSSLSLPLQSIGINCSTPSAISYAVPILTKLVEGTHIKVSAYANCFRTTTSEWMREEEGECGDVSCTTSVKETNKCAEDYDEEGYLLPDAYVKVASKWVEGGATIIGGCCGSRPSHLNQVALALKNGQRIES
ncbi:hypothetical protein ACHAXR_007687 [Thalassiosira sp. AJA248-18]